MQRDSVLQWFKTNPGDAALMLLMGLVGLYSGLSARNVLIDDAMITFRVAENLAYGRGFVYNVGEYVQVTTTPLYALVLAIGTWLVGSAPRAALLLNLTLATLTPILTYNIGRRLSSRITGLVAALLLTFAPLLVIAFSMESYLYVSLILASLEAYTARRYTLTGMLIGLTTMVRGDAVLFGAVLLTYDFVVNRRLYWRLIIPAIGLPALWYLFATVYYGSPFPATLQAKTAQGEFDWLGKHFISGFYKEYWKVWLSEYSLLFYLFPVLIIIGLFHAIRQNRLWLILVIHNLLYITAFYALGVTFAEWYYAPTIPALAFMTACGVQAGANLIQKGSQKLNLSTPIPQLSGPLGAIILTGLLLSTLYPVTSDIIATHPDWKAQAYPDAARWVAQNTNTSANLSTIDIGHLGYWSERKIIDIVGLAQPDVAAHIAEGDFGYAIREYQPDMVLIGATWLPEIQSEDWFQATYTPRHTLKPSGINEPIVLFTRPKGVKVQGHAIPAAQLQSLAEDFNQQILLTGYHTNLPHPGELLHVTLVWQVEAPLAVDYTTFVQLVDANNNIVAQHDSKPQAGFYPTPYWKAGEQIIDRYALPLPADVPPGTYRIILGFYNADDGIRLQLLDDTGSYKNDHVRLDNIKIVR